jgi:2-dehydropantoate 2-reductase
MVAGMKRKSMHLLILGAGALGSLLGARLARTGVKLTLLSTNNLHMQAIRHHGLVVEELDGTETQHRLTTCAEPAALDGAVDLVLVVVKSYAIEAAVASVTRHSHAGTLFLTLQNGIGNWERIARIVGKDAVLVGTTSQGATLLEPGRIRHGGNGPTFVGEPEGPPTERVESIIRVFMEAGLRTESKDNMEQLIWEKLHVNVGINAITALTGIRNGFIADHEAATEVCRAAVEEARSVAAAKGMVIGQDMVDRVLQVARATAVNRSSMGQDADRKKQTEIDAINGAIVALGEKLLVPTPVNRTLTLLVKTLEANYLRAKDM